MKAMIISAATVAAAGIVTVGALWSAIPSAQAQAAAGKAVYDVKCAACHKTGLLAAPKEGIAADWTARLAKGRDTLVSNAVKGIKQMPPKGGNPGLSDAEVASAVDYMLSLLPAGRASAAPPAKPQPAASTPAAPEKVAQAAAPAPQPKRVPVRSARPSGANAFNRLMKPPSQRNPPPAKDGIHDPANEGTHVLQSPRDAFDPLPKATSGNRVDWVAALDNNAIDPRYDRLDPNARPVIMDLNIVREVKGSMPDVVYPHKQHTEWLDCSNCHPAIFLPQKGANQISMAGILLGKQCGVCHGKVAFPVADCRRCHSGTKGGSQ